MNLEAFVVDAVDAISFKLIRNPSDVDSIKNIFNPAMAHQVYGDNENIFGYKDLDINVYYSAGPLDVYYDVKYLQKVDDLPTELKLKADDVHVITEVFPENYFTNLEEFLSTMEKKTKSFKPFGEKVSEYSTKDGRTFETYLCDSETPNFRKYHTKFESFIFWFIDASSRIEHDENWRFFVVFEKYNDVDGEIRYASVGYASIYLCFAYPDMKRPRISQFLILPPFQNKGIGSNLIETIYNRFQAEEKVCDITVEDPSEEFQRIRHTIDVKLLKDVPSFSPDKLKTGFSIEMMKEAKKLFKINPKQCRIIYEILRLKITDKKKPVEYKSYRLDVKKRLNMNYLKEMRNLKKLVNRGFKMPVEKKLLLPTSEENMEQLDGLYKNTEKYYEGILGKM